MNTDNTRYDHRDLESNKRAEEGGKARLRESGSPIQGIIDELPPYARDALDQALNAEGETHALLAMTAVAKRVVEFLPLFRDLMREPDASKLKKPAKEIVQKAMEYARED